MKCLVRTSCQSSHCCVFHTWTWLPPVSHYRLSLGHVHICITGWKTHRNFADCSWCKHMVKRLCGLVSTQKTKKYSKCSSAVSFTVASLRVLHVHVGLIDIVLFLCLALRSASCVDCWWKRLLLGSVCWKHDTAFPLGLWVRLQAWRCGVGAGVRLVRSEMCWWW